MTKNITKNLPRNWKEQVAQSLAKKGFSLTEGDVYNLAKGRVKNMAAQKAVLETLKEIKKKYTAEVQALEKLKKEVAI